MVTPDGDCRCRNCLPAHADVNRQLSVPGQRPAVETEDNDEFSDE